MKFAAISILISGSLLLPACSLWQRRAAAKPPAATPKPNPPAPPVDTASDLPISVPQTQVNLPTPQPIQAEALATIRPEAPPPPEPVNPTVKPRNSTSRTEPRQQVTVPLPPAGPAAPPATPPASRPRIRPVETPAERQRLLAGIGARQKQVQDALARAKNRQLTEAEKSAVERIQAFLEQTEAALKDQDLQQADALSNRALLLCQVLSEK